MSELSVLFIGLDADQLAGFELPQGTRIITVKSGSEAL
jgi:hypothetical protein